VAAALALDAAARAIAPVLRTAPSGWRNVVSQHQRIQLGGAHETQTVAYRLTRTGLQVDGHPDLQLVRHDERRVVFDDAGVRRTFEVARYGHEVYVDSSLGSVRFAVVERFPDPADQMAPGSLLAPMPGSVVRIVAAAGERVTAGQPLLWLEAMKMQHQINAPADGVLAELPVREGQQVEVGAVLAIVTTEGDPA
jgi:biotin carboxyl carrier protein